MIPSFPAILNNGFKKPDASTAFGGGNTVASSSHRPSPLRKRGEQSVGVFIDLASLSGQTADWYQPSHEQSLFPPVGDLESSDRFIGQSRSENNSQQPGSSSDYSPSNSSISSEPFDSEVEAPRKRKAINPFKRPALPPKKGVVSSGAGISKKQVGSGRLVPAASKAQVAKVNESPAEEAKRLSRASRLANNRRTAAISRHRLLNGLKALETEALNQGLDIKALMPVSPDRKQEYAHISDVDERRKAKNRITADNHRKNRQLYISNLKYAIAGNWEKIQTQFASGKKASSTLVKAKPKSPVKAPTHLKRISLVAAEPESDEAAELLPIKHEPGPSALPGGMSSPSSPVFKLTKAREDSAEDWETWMSVDPPNNSWLHADLGNGLLHF